MSEAEGNVTRLLLDWSGGDRQALEELMPLVYDQLQLQASGCLKGERPGHTLETSGLVNEAFLRLIDQERVHWRDRAHFFAIAGRMMRRILVDHARRHASAKRGGRVEKVALPDLDLVPVEPAPDLVALDDALGALAREDPDGAQIIELRYFGGLNREEIAAVMGVSSASVTRRWRMARAWLYDDLVHRRSDGV